MFPDASEFDSFCSAIPDDLSFFLDIQNEASSNSNPTRTTKNVEEKVKEEAREAFESCLKNEDGIDARQISSPSARPPSRPRIGLSSPSQRHRLHLAFSPSQTVPVVGVSSNNLEASSPTNFHRPQPFPPPPPPPLPHPELTHSPLPTPTGFSDDELLDRLAVAYPPGSEGRETLRRMDAGVVARVETREAEMRRKGM